MLLGFAVLDLRMQLPKQSRQWLAGHITRHYAIFYYYYCYSRLTSVVESLWCDYISFLSIIPGEYEHAIFFASDINLC